MALIIGIIASAFHADAGATGAIGTVSVTAPAASVAGPVAISVAMPSAIVMSAPAATVAGPVAISVAMPSAVVVSTPDGTATGGAGSVRTQFVAPLAAFVDQDDDQGQYVSSISGTFFG